MPSLFPTSIELLGPGGAYKVHEENNNNEKKYKRLEISEVALNRRRHTSIFLLRDLEIAPINAAIADDCVRVHGSLIISVVDNSSVEQHRSAGILGNLNKSANFPPGLSMGPTFFINNFAVSSRPSEKHQFMSCFQWLVVLQAVALYTVVTDSCSQSRSPLMIALPISLVLERGHSWIGDEMNGSCGRALVLSERCNYLLIWFSVQ